MNGQTAIYTQLLNDSAVVALLSTYNSNPCLGIGSVEPDEWGADLTTALIYRLNPVDYRSNVNIADFVVNCRASLQTDAESLASAVIEATNRKEITGGGRFYCVKGSPIQPQDNTDNFNIPVTITVKSTFDLN